MEHIDSNITETAIDFSVAFYKHMITDEPHENAFMSPCSVLIVMAMIQLGAAGNTLEQMSSTLKLQLENESFLDSLKTFLETMKIEDEQFTLGIANRLYPIADKTILEDYQRRVSEIVLADVVPLDFANDSEGCRFIINEWVEKETKGRITNLLAPGMIHAFTAMVAVNAIYFKGDWAEAFEKEDTVIGEFIIDGGMKVSVDMMTKKTMQTPIGYSEDLSCKVLQLPYKGQSLGMFIILPDDADGLPALERRLNTRTMKRLISDVFMSSVDVSLPKFSLETTYSLNKILSELGMPDLFDESKADLSRMSKFARLSVSHVVHTAFVQVDEEGTEAAAATAGIIWLSIPETFCADHPFLFIIWDHRVGIPLFMGRYVSPKEPQGAHDEL